MYRILFTHTSTGGYLRYSPLWAIANEAAVNVGEQRTPSLSVL